MTMHMTMTEHVVRVETATSSFPGILKRKFGDRVEFAATGSRQEIVATDVSPNW
jgi:hypothetical protein